MIALDGREVVVIPHGHGVRWVCDTCADHGAGTTKKLPAGWRVWSAPELGCDEAVLCPGCWDAQAASVDLEVTGEGLQAGVHPW